jgi:hypothetical protein
LDWEKIEAPFGINGIYWVGFDSYFPFLSALFLSKMAFVTCDFGVEKNCGLFAKLQGGQRRFCEDHHRESLQTDPVYAEAVNAYNSDPILVAASDTFRRILEEQGGTNALIFMFAPLDEALRVFEAEQRAARERQLPGIHAAEEYVDEAYRIEQMRAAEIDYDAYVAADKEFRGTHTDDDACSDSCECEH